MLAAPDHSSPREACRRARGFAVFVVTFALYAATASRGVQWGDSTHFMRRIVEGDVTSREALLVDLSRTLMKSATSAGNARRVFADKMTVIARALRVNRRRNAASRCDRAGCRTGGTL